MGPLDPGLELGFRRSLTRPAYCCSPLGSILAMQTRKGIGEESKSSGRESWAAGSMKINRAPRGRKHAVVAGKHARGRAGRQGGREGGRPRYGYVSPCLALCIDRFPSRIAGVRSRAQRLLIAAAPGLPEPRRGNTRKTLLRDPK